MRVIVKEVGKSPQVKEIVNTLEAFKTLVNGYIEAVHIDNEIILICNEEGKLQGFPPNFRIGNDVIVGTAVFVSHNGAGDFASLNDWHIEDVMSKFYA